jgi:hypothetical protein
VLPVVRESVTQRALCAGRPDHQARRDCRSARAGVSPSFKLPRPQHRPPGRLDTPAGPGRLPRPRTAPAVSHAATLSAALLPRRRRPPPPPAAAARRPSRRPSGPGHPARARGPTALPGRRAAGRRGRRGQMVTRKGRTWRDATGVRRRHVTTLKRRSVTASRVMMQRDRFHVGQLLAACMPALETSNVTARNVTAPHGFPPCMTQTKQGGRG